jgi:hypothetical protein
VLLLCSISVFSQKQFKVLLFTKTAGWHHESIHEGVEAIRKMGERHFFDVDWQENTMFINEKNLEKYQVIIFLNTTADVLNDEQQKAFNQLVQEENLSADKTHKLIENYLFAEREPLRDEVLDLIEGDKPSVLVRKKLGDKILNKIVGFVETFINGISSN